MLGSPLAAGLLALLLAAAGFASASAVPRISKEDLRARLGASELVVLDLRVEPVWNMSSSKIPGAVRETPSEVELWARKYPKRKTFVLYCS